MMLELVCQGKSIGQLVDDVPKDATIRQIDPILQKGCPTNSQHPQNSRIICELCD
jgi:hypothetical protein